MDDPTTYLLVPSLLTGAAALVFFAYEVGFKKGVGLKRENNILREAGQQHLNTIAAMDANFQMLKQSCDKLTNDNARLVSELEAQAKAALKPTRTKRKPRQ